MKVSGQPASPSALSPREGPVYWFRVWLGAPQSTTGVFNIPGCTIASHSIDEVRMGGGPGVRRRVTQWISRHASSGSVVLLLHSSRSVVQFGAVLSVVTEMQQKVERSVKTSHSVVGYIVPKINTRKERPLFVDCWYFQCTNVVSR